MKICITFDGTVVEQDGRRHGDTEAPLRLRVGAKAALKSLRAAGHLLVLSSTRANLSLRVDPMLDPLVSSGTVPFDRGQWQQSKSINEARYQAMRRFVEEQLAGIFHAIDDGRQGRIAADLYIDGKSVRLGHGGVGAQTWEDVAATWGRVYPAKRGA